MHNEIHRKKGHFWNQRAGNLIIRKLDSITKEPLAGVEFKVTYTDGSPVDTANGTVSSNGVYVTDSNGEIRISGIVGSIVITETKTIDGYVIDESERIHTVTVNPNDTQTVTVYNGRVGSILIKKMDASTREPLSGILFKVTRTDGSVVGTSNGEFRTDAQGLISIPAEPGSYIVRELQAKPGYLLDDAARTIEVKDGRTYEVEFLNQPLGSVKLVYKYL